MQNEPLVAIVAVHTAENELSKVCSIAGGRAGCRGRCAASPQVAAAPSLAQPRAGSPPYKSAVQRSDLFSAGVAAVAAAVTIRHLDKL